MLVEKHLGYEYKHLYSRDWNAMQGFHHLMHIAHLLHILVPHQTTLWPMVLRLSIRGTMIYCARVIVFVFWKNAIVVENHYAAMCLDTHSLGIKPLNSTRGQYKTGGSRTRFRGG